MAKQLFKQTNKKVALKELCFSAEKKQQAKIFPLAMTCKSLCRKRSFMVWVRYDNDTVFAKMPWPRTKIAKCKFSRPRSCKNYSPNSFLKTFEDCLITFWRETPPQKTLSKKSFFSFLERRPIRLNLAKNEVAEISGNIPLSRFFRCAFKNRGWTKYRPFLALLDNGFQGGQTSKFKTFVAKIFFLKKSIENNWEPWKKSWKWKSEAAIKGPLLYCRYTYIHLGQV